MDGMLLAIIGGFECHFKEQPVGPPGQPAAQPKAAHKVTALVATGKYRLRTGPHERDGYRIAICVLERTCSGLDIARIKSLRKVHRNSLGYKLKLRD